MNVEIKPGKYVVAVSGGVDSMVLLNLLSQKPKLDLVVAHFDHGIRDDSVEDRKLVEGLAKKYGLEFFYESGKLGVNASEALAREKRYEFLRKVKNNTGAQAIVTAHHQDDVLETAILNLMRGTSRRGLSSLRSTENITRPLLNIPKAEIVEYARTHNLRWREDSTNSDEKYLRNYVRRQIVPKLSLAQRGELLQIIDATAESNQKINYNLNKILNLYADGSTINRRWFTGLPHAVAREVMASWLLQAGVELDKKLIERLVIASKTGQMGKQFDIDKKHVLDIHDDILALLERER